MGMTHMSEMLSIVCEKTNQPLGCMPRSEAIANRAWCRSTNVFVMNSKGEILCHQRSLNKERFPGAWSTHLGGHVGEGETYETNAAKEMEEECGVRAHPSRILRWRTTRLNDARLWVAEFVILHDAPVDTFIPQPGEVERFAWLSPEEIAARAASSAEQWVAGTHYFAQEYFCMRAALNAAHAVGAINVPTDLHAWHPATA
jgi:isopentenyldiphosphate isomerase